MQVIRMDFSREKSILWQTNRPEYEEIFVSTSAIAWWRLKYSVRQLLKRSIPALLIPRRNPPGAHEWFVTLQTFECKQGEGETNTEGWLTMNDVTPVWPFRNPRFTQNPPPQIFLSKRFLHHSVPPRVTDRSDLKSQWCKLVLKRSKIRLLRKGRQC